MSEDVKTTMEEWIALKNQLAEIRKDVKVLTIREKTLKEEINNFMTTKEVDVVKLEGLGKISTKSRQSKGTFNREAVKRGLSTFFGGNEAQVEGAMTAIEDGLDIRETSTVTLTKAK